MKTIFKRLLLALLFLPTIILAQSTVTGTVTEQATALPIPTVNVIIKDTSRGTATDFDGNYTLEVENGDVLVFSYIGYLSQEITYNGQSKIDVSLVEDAAQLEEVVIIGYGSVKKEDLTGSVDVVTSEDFNKGAITSTDQLLRGKAAGVRITDSGGSPDSAPTIRIRGGASLFADNSPLIVIDGVALGGQNPAGVSNPLSLINPNDVESFSILKDASATAIYGSRASNGVIIITTKKGTSGEAKYTFSTNVSVDSAGEGLDMMNSEEYVRFIKQYHPTYQSELGVPVGEVSTTEPSSIIQVNIYDTDGNITGTENRAVYDTNWRDAILRTAISSNTNFSVRANLGGVLPFRASVGYSDLEGVVRTDDYKRYSAAFKLSPKLLNDNLKIDANAKLTFVDKNATDAGGALGGAIVFDPTKPVYDNNSIFGGYYTNTALDGTRLLIDGQSNPLALLEQRERPERAYRFLGNVEFDYTMPFLPELKAVVNVGLDASRSKIKESFDNNAISAFGIDTTNDNAVVFNPGVSYRERQHITNATFDSYLQYAKNIEEGLITRYDVQLGYSYQNFKTDGNSDRFRNNVDTGFREVDFNPENPNNRYYNDQNLQSFFGRTNVNILDKYLVTVSLRADGSSFFVTDDIWAEEAWGFFPAAALAWKIKQENFLKDVNFVNDLKLRLGYGKTGQQNISGAVGTFYPTSPLFAVGSQNSQYLPGANLYSALPFQTGLTWEKTSTYNLGLDFNFFKNSLISGSFDIFKRETTDLLTDALIPPGQGLTDSFIKNVGTTESEGFELNLNLNPVQNEDFNLSFNGNISYATTEVTDLGGINTLRIGGGLLGTGSNLFFNKLGEEPGLAGVFKQVYDASGNPIPGAFVDLNGDNQITEDDKYFEALAPNWTFGFGLNVNYKNWDLSASFRGQLDGKLYDFNELRYGHTGSAEPNNNTSITNVLNFYDGAANPVFDEVIGNTQFSDYFLQDASFLRCQNIVVGYNFDSNFIKNTSMRIYGSVNNPFIITNYEGQDPENNGGIDGAFYPRPTTISMGVNIDF
ncbi:SusC/RagA family TonB-linked outer membrane protein [Olleya marilimosa]|uniref:SusC/RagA family TonB-linked outer membrane protein n=1 Tax=Olleya marilimosa TaxID=272164 RepID=A0ABR8LTN5_9FLAO|nr:SusC/RagA family TonB-linked outer membrane protein [Olleya marilimosa]MBD3862743.1 SusC/RagA family TonB-linked outer membrane protein [Olleya marilimosa]